MAKLNWIALSLLWSSILLAGTVEPSMAKNEISTMGPQSDAEVFLNQGYRLMSDGRYDESVLVYDKAIELNQSLAEAWRSITALTRAASFSAASFLAAPSSR
ncbi:MAG: tetratricopeptide repeat protein [Methanosarcinales archaeon]|nr:tetratricopeptide repeat protein [Methanosarcinales archaeon]